MYAHVLQSFLIVGCASSLLLAQETSNPKEPAAGSETDTASSTITLPIRPSGRYAFLSRLGSLRDSGKLEPTMPFTWIEAEWTEIGNTFRGEPHLHHRVRLSRDRSALYVTCSIFKGERKDVVKTYVYRKGEIAEREYARICLILEQFKVGDATCDLGRLTPEDNVFFNGSSLRVHVAANDSVHVYRNDDGGIGDYRYWLVQTVVKQQAREDIWWKVPPPKNASEVTDAAEP